jgi:hypothetical protein
VIAVGGFSIAYAWRLWKLEHFGPTCDAFTFKTRFPAPGEVGAPMDMKPDPWCMGRA